MDEQPPVPLSLNIVATLFLLDGVGSLVKMGVKLYSHSLFLDMGLLGIPIFFGLRRYSRGWRTCALVFLWLGMVATIVMLPVGLMFKHPLDFEVCGVILGKISPIWLTFVGIFGFLFTFWQYWVLTRPWMKKLFGLL